MIHNQYTAGGLLVTPTIYLMDAIGPTDNDNSTETHTDTFFGMPVAIGYTFFDPNKIQKIGDKIKYNRQPENVFFDTNGFMDDDDYTKMTLTGTYSYAAGGFINDIGKTRINHEELNTVYDLLAKKAAHNIQTGKVKQDDLLKFIAKDNGAYKGNELISFEPHAHTYRQKNAYERIILDHIPENIIKKLQDFGSSSSPYKHFGDLAQDCLRMTPDIDNIHNKSAEQHVIAISLMSAIINGIGARDIFPTLLESFKKVRPATVDALFNSSDLSGINHRIILRSLPINSPYHTKAVKGYYNKIC